MQAHEPRSLDTMTAMRWMPAIVMLVACGDDPDAKPDAPMVDATPSVACDSVTPDNATTAYDTCLCTTPACTEVADGIRAYTPRWELYSDGATKRRWIYLPPGAKIETQEADRWSFPVGTKVWKEFSRNGTRVETRLIMRTASTGANSDWFYATYVWNAAQDASVLETFGVPDANGTPHDVPSRNDCKGCHEEAPARVLGFTALQLDYDSPHAGDVELVALGAGDPDWLSVKPSGSVPHYPLPGNTTVEQPVLGYMFANCSHCHNPDSSVFADKTQVAMHMKTTALQSLAIMPAYVTMIGQNGSSVDGVTKIITAGQPDQSTLIKRFETDNLAQRMPALGSEMMDTTAATLFRTWVTNLQ
jgi:hypothetical protein